MSGGATFLDFGALCKGATSSIATATAGGTGDNTKATGETIDRLGFNSAALFIGYKTTLAASETLSIAVERQQSDDGSTWETAEVIQASTVAETGAGTNVHGCLRFRESYETAARYVRYNVTPDLSASGTDTASVTTLVVLGGAESLPVAQD